MKPNRILSEGRDTWFKVTDPDSGTSVTVAHTWMADSTTFSVSNGRAPHSTEKVPESYMKYAHDLPKLAYELLLAHNREVNV